MDDAQGDMGQLGLGDDEAEVLVPTIVKAPGGMKALQVSYPLIHAALFHLKIQVRKDQQLHSSP